MLATRPRAVNIDSTALGVDNEDMIWNSMLAIIAGGQWPVSELMQSVGQGMATAIAVLKNLFITGLKRGI